MLYRDNTLTYPLCERFEFVIIDDYSYRKDRILRHVQFEQVSREIVHRVSHDECFSCKNERITDKINFYC